MNLNHFINGITLRNSNIFFKFFDLLLSKFLGSNIRNIYLTNRVYSEFYENLYSDIINRSTADYLTVTLTNFGLQQLSMRRFNYSGSEEYLYISGTNGLLCSESLKGTVNIKGTLICNNTINKQNSLINASSKDYSIEPKKIIYANKNEIIESINKLDPDLKLGIVVFEGIDDNELIKESLILLNKKITEYADVIIVDYDYLIKDLKKSFLNNNFNISKILKTESFSIIKLDTHYDHYLSKIPLGYK